MIFYNVFIQHNIDMHNVNKKILHNGGIYEIAVVNNGYKHPRQEIHTTA